jgi:hypothetical protein
MTGSEALAVTLFLILVLVDDVVAVGTSGGERYAMFVTFYLHAILFL